MSDSESVSAPLSVAGISLELSRMGSGPPLLFLHGHVGRDRAQPFLKGLARNWTVHAPSHPGYGRSEHPVWMTKVSDLALFYLEFLETQKLRDVTLVGASLGGWIAAELATRSTDRIARIVLSGPLGIRLGERDVPDIYDIFTGSPDDVIEHLYHDPKFGARDYASYTEDQAYIEFRERETTAVYGWSPYMHDPSLKHWLQRIRVPALVVRGEHDGIVSEAYARGYAERIPGAGFRAIANSGHFPHIETPEALADIIDGFARQSQSIAA